METGGFTEIYKYAKNFDLPLQWVVEDNNMSVHTPTDMRKQGQENKKYFSEGVIYLRVRDGVPSPRNRKVGKLLDEIL